MPRKMINPLVKPYLKWAGGKRQLLPEIRRHMPDNLSRYTYYEPFIGAGAVLFDVQPRNAVINDFNEQLILTYQTIRDNVDELIKALRIHVEQNSEDYYYAVRAQDRDVNEFERLSNVEKAARIIYLNKTCYNGLYRVNAQGLFNVPYGKYVRPAICEESVLKAIHKYFHDNNIQILNGDFANAVQEAAQHAFVYFDPPYHSPDNTNFTGYQAGGFNEAEQTRLRNIFTQLSANGAKCLLSNSDTPFIRELYQGFEIIEVQARRAINSDAAGRGDVSELLIKSWGNA
jgi:DNA adenine methylase